MIDPTLRLEHLARAAADPETRCCSSTWCSGTAPSPTRPRCWRPRCPAYGSRSWSRSSVRRPTRRGWTARSGRSRTPAPRCTSPTRGPPAAPSSSSMRRGRRMSTPTAVVNVGADLLADAIADQAVPVTRVDWRPPMEGTEADLADRGRRPAARRRQRAGAGRDARGHRDPRRRGPGVRAARAARRGSSCTPGRRSSWDRAPGPLRGALMGGAALEGLVDDPEDAVALFEAGTAGLARAVPPPLHGRPDGRGGHAVDVAVGARGRRQRPPYVLLAQRGARQGAALRRLRARRAHPAALAGRRARARCCRRVRCARPGRSTSPGSSPRCSRWATRRTTATAPAR